MKIFSLNREMIQGIIFDIDLTLYDNRRYYAVQETLLMEQLARHLNRLPDEVKEEIREYRDGAAARTGSRPALGPTLGALYGISVEQISTWREEMIAPEEYLSRDEQLKASLSRLSRRYRLAAVTNNPTSIARRTLKTLAVAEYFPTVIGIDITRESKPAMRPFNLVVEKFGCRHENVVSVGDRYEVDLHLPLQHGMAGILVEKVTDVYRLPEVLEGQPAIDD